MPNTVWRAILPLLLPAASLACSDTPATNPDAQATAEDAAQTLHDAGNANADAAPTDPDATAMNGDAAATGDAGAGADATPGADATTPGADSGVPSMASLAPGSHVDLGDARVSIGDTFGAVRMRLGAGTRTAAANTRSYEWQRAGGVALTVWFTNTNLDDDDPPADVDNGDQVLWIAVSGGFTGRTMGGLGIGSTRAEVVAAYGVAPRETPIDMPAGRLAQYYSRGVLLAYDANDTVRTVTITKRYPREPNGRIDLANLRIDFGGGDVITMNPLSGSEPGDIRQLLGPPDSEGPIPNQNDLELMNYAFFGVEFVISTAIGDHAATAILHAPWYGTTGNMTPGLGSTRAEFEAYVSAPPLSASGPTASMRTMGLFCFTRGATSFGATYSADMPPRVTAIVLGQCR